MRKNLITAIAVLLLIIGSIIPCYALSDTQVTAIQSYLDETRQKTGVPGMALSVRVGSDITYFTSGYADKEESIPVSEETLFELASLSKAYTALGILLLEEQGLLSMEDPIQKHLPWFTLRYKGKPVDMNSVTLNHFLHHTSGLVNNRHIGLTPMGDGADMLQKTVEAFLDAELAFMPGERFDYGTMNYDVLGLVIAEMSGQSYDDFIITQVLEPLGLHETYMYGRDAFSTGRLAKGYVTSFLRIIPVEAPKYEGSKPSGYIISCSKDMARWMDIQLGLVDDIPEIYRAIVEKSHYANTSVPAVTDLYYAGGWVVDAAGEFIEHGGDNLNFTSDIKMYPKSQIAITLLTNGNLTNNRAITESIRSIIDGELNQKHTLGLYKIFDGIGVVTTIVGILFAFLFLLLGLRRWRNRSKNLIPKKRIALIAIWIIITAAIALSGKFFPALFGCDWKSMFSFTYLYSFATGFIALALASVSVTWFVFARRK